MLIIKDIQKSDGLIDRRYKLIQKIGGGGFSEVWLAQDVKVRMKVALKFYLGADNLNEEGKEMFREEFERQSQLNHENILHINHYNDELLVYYEDKELQRFEIPYLELPYCQRGAANKLVGKMSEDELWRFAKEVSSGLAYIHAHQPRPIIHQDIKPANILIDDNGHFLITDFGISVDLRATINATSTSQNEGALTREYAGKERFKNQKPVMASDIWALGATLYELATGNVPFGEWGGLAQENSKEKTPRFDKPLSSSMKELICACLSEETWDRPSALDVLEWASKKRRKGFRFSSSQLKKLAIAAALCVFVGVSTWLLWPRDKETETEGTTQLSIVSPNDKKMMDLTEEASAMVERQWTYIGDKDSAIVYAKRMAMAGELYQEALSMDSVSENQRIKAQERWAASQNIIDSNYVFFAKEEKKYRQWEAYEPADKYKQCCEELEKYVSIEITKTK